MRLPDQFRREDRGYSVSCRPVESRYRWKRLTDLCLSSRPTPAAGPVRNPEQPEFSPPRYGGSDPLFSAVHESGIGTFETCRWTLGMSAYRGRPEIVRSQPERRDFLECMVRPCVARGFVNLADAVLHQCIRPLIGACCAPGHHGYQRAFELISGQASSGPFGSPVFACAGKTDPPSSSHPLADLGG